MKSMSATPIEGLSPAQDREREIVAVVHRLRNQAFALALGINVLKYPCETDLERQEHLSHLESVVSEMAREFLRLEHWLIELGYKRVRG